MIKRLGRHPWVLSGVGSLLAGYLKLVYHTNRFVIDPDGVHARMEEELPVIVAMWHGQHFMVPFAKPVSLACQGDDLQIRPMARSTRLLRANSASA